MNFFLRCCTPVLLLLAGCAGKPPAPESPGNAQTAPKLEIITREERIQVDQGSTRLVLRNPHGDVRLRITDQAQVGVHATIQRIGEIPLDPTLDIRQHGGVFELNVRYPQEAALRTKGDHSYGRVDLGIWVPASLALDLETTDGLLQVKRARSAVYARTTSGALQVTAGAEIDLASDSGDIAFSQYSGDWSTPARVRSDRGHIYASVPAFADVELTVQAGGRIESAPPLPQPVATDAGGMRLDANFGKALRKLQIDSASGDIYLYPVVPDSTLSREDENESR
jgi:hypothetical protein